jgi:hypothetical protein
MGLHISLPCPTIRSIKKSFPFMALNTPHSDKRHALPLLSHSRPLPHGKECAANLRQVSPAGLPAWQTTASSYVARVSHPQRKPAAISAAKYQINSYLLQQMQ